MKKKLVKIATISKSIDILLKGQLTFFKNKYNLKVVASYDNSVQNIYSREGVKVNPITIHRTPKILKDIFSLINLYLYFIKERPFIIHSITPKAGLLSMIAGYFARVPIRIHTFTGLVFEGKNGLYRRTLILFDKVTCYFATNVYPEGEGVKNTLINHKITSKSLKVLAYGNINGIDVEFFNISSITKEHIDFIQKKHNISTNDFIFIYIGRIVGDKGINELIQAFVFLQQKYYNIKLLILGEEEVDFDELELATKKEIYSNTNIITTGFINDIRPYLVVSDVHILPSYREGFPNVILQAGSMGVPSIVSNISGSNEIITHEYNGLLIEKKCVKSLIQAMKRTIEDKSLLMFLKSNTRSIIKKKYTNEIVWNALLDEYMILENKYNSSYK